MQDPAGSAIALPCCLHLAELAAKGESAIILKQPCPRPEFEYASLTEADLVASDEPLYPELPGGFNLPSAAGGDGEPVYTESSAPGHEAYAVPPDAPSRNHHYEQSVGHNPAYYSVVNDADTPWLHGNITRDEAELRIMNMRLQPNAATHAEAAGRMTSSKGLAPAAGTYLVRSKDEGDWVVSAYDGSTFRHHRIIRNQETGHITFNDESLVSLVR